MSAHFNPESGWPKLAPLFFHRIGFRLANLEANLANLLSVFYTTSQCSQLANRLS